MRCNAAWDSSIQNNGVFVCCEDSKNGIEGFGFKLVADLPKHDMPEV